MKREIRRKGFTPVELLIVIVVIGILSAMMMISSSEAVSSAKATNIVNNLRAMKVAALSYYEEHSDKTEFTAEDLSNKNLIRYLQKTNDGGNPDAEASKVFEAYAVVVDDWKDWYARCDITKVVNSTNEKNTERAAILRKLEGKSRSQGISFSTKDDGSSRTQKLSNQQYIYMWIR